MLEDNMWYEPEFKFLQSILKKMNLQFFQLSQEKPSQDSLDLGIRNFLGRKEEYCYLFQELPFQATQNTIYKLTDTYLCKYLYLMLPEDPASVLLIGPYMSANLSQKQLLQEAERFSVPPQLFNELENYYSGIPVLNDDSFLLSVINSFAETLWGSSEAYTMVNLKEDDVLPNSIPMEEDSFSSKKALLTMEIMERRYSFENEMIRAVSLGMSHKAEAMLSNFNELTLQQRVSDPLRNMKNYCIIMNTLMRKAAEQGSVHPIYLDRVSSEFAQKIELAGSIPSGYKIMTEMVSTYCRLVTKHSSKNHSLFIRKTLVFIDFDLSGDLSLHTLATIQNISSGYLSALFKKEVGLTLTDYVNSRRVKQASQLLRSGVLQIQTIAHYCGIPDVNYFSKTFKRYLGCTPKDYRNSLQTHKEI